MSDREESIDRQENGSHRSNGSNGSPSRHVSESPQRRPHSHSRTPPPTTSSSTHRKRSHSRSRSHSHRYSRHRREHSKSHSRSPHSSRRGVRDRRSPVEGYDRRSRHESNSYESRPRERGHSRSPMSSRRRHVGNRENPPTGTCVGVFGLSIYTHERDLKDVFTKYGPLEDVQIVYDAQSGRSRGFAFVYFQDKNDAALAKERCNGIEIDGRKIRVDFSITQRAHTPTPGIYMGKPTYSPPPPPSRNRGGERGASGGGGGGDRGGYERGGRYGGGGGGERGGYERSPSPYYSRERRVRYSRSRSHSPLPKR